MDWYRGKRIFITGGSSGIGKAIATAAARAGAHVAIAARRQHVLDEALDEIRAARRDVGQVVAAYPLDIADLEGVRRTAPEVLRDLGGLDVLVNNAGMNHVGYMKDDTDEIYEQVVRVNYLGSVWVTRAFLPHFQERREGTIAFVSSVLGLAGLFGCSAYAASKHAMVGYAESLRQDVLRDRINVCILFPPETDTPMHWAEQSIIPHETKALSGSIKLMPADDVARDFMAAMARGRLHCIPGMETRTLVWFARHFPGLTRWVMDRDLKKAWR